MSTDSSSQSAAGGLRLKGYSPLVWALRRTVYGIVILSVTIACAAWLFYAAIDPDGEATAEPTPAARTANPAAVATPGERPLAGTIRAE